MPRPTPKRHPLVLPALLCACFAAGAALSLYDGLTGLAGGLLAGAPVIVIARAIRKAQSSR